MAPATHEKLHVTQGISALAIAMGIGRFFYTPILPLMLSVLHWNHSSSAWVATANYTGYFLGSLCISRQWLTLSPSLFRTSLISSSLLLAATAFLENPTQQAIIRLFAGVASALVFISITQRAAQVTQHPHSSGKIYGGVGTGILLSATIVLIGNNFLTWSQLWIAASILSFTLSCLAWKWPFTAQRQSEVSKNTPTSHEQTLTFLLLAYFLQGAGYIIIGTYLVALSEPLLGESAAASTWAVAGISAIPSPLLWSEAAQRWGTKNTLKICYILQVSGAILAIFSSNLLMLIFSALLFGATFMGITMLTIKVGIERTNSSAAAQLTTWYSLGQISGPAFIATFSISSLTHNFILAAITLTLASLLTIKAL